jgi:hypothetical protein
MVASCLKTGVAELECPGGNSFRRIIRNSPEALVKRKGSPVLFSFM